MNANARRTADSAITRLNLKPTWGVIGDYSGNMGTLSMLTRNIYYVRYPTTNGFSMPVPIRGPYDSPVTFQPGQCVQLGYDSDNIPYIKSTSFGPTLAAGGNPVPIPPLAGGPVVTQSQIATLKVFQDYIQPSLMVNINGWKTMLGSILYDYPGTSQFDLTSFVPGSGHCVVGVFIKDDFLTPIAFASTSISLNDVLGDADINAVLAQAPATYTPLVFYGVKTGATQILDGDILLDGRQVIAPGMSNVTVVPVRVVTAAGAVTVTTADYLICINKTVGAATTVNLPANPTTGQKFVVKDKKGDAAANNITITPAAGNIDGAATKVMNVNRQSVTIIYDGAEWSVN